jgi:uncharacterized protein (DUF1015 family)
VFALVRIVELGKGVWPHEETRAKPKADRLEIMRHCMANISPIYAIYNSKEKATAGILASVSGEPYMSAADADGTLHKIFRISDPLNISLISRELSDMSIFIADGHHRYEVALEFKKEMDLKTGRLDEEPRPWDYVLMFLADMADSGITILPTHRMVKGMSSADSLFAKLADSFGITELPEKVDINKEVMVAGKHAFGLYLGNKRRWFLLKYRGGSLNNVQPALQTLDVVILRELILNMEPGISNLAYEMSADEAVKKADTGKYDAVFVLNPTGTDDIERVASAGLRMPAKSTYFYPKLMTGMVINKFQA